MGDYGQYIVPEAADMVNFKVGQPAASMLPLDKIREAAQLKFAETDPMYLQYGHIKGYPKFRRTLGEFLSKGYHAPVDPEELFITNGNTGGLSLITSLFLASGDLVFMEEPTYFLALSIMRDFKMNVRQIPMEQDGLNVVELERLLAQGVIPKMLYLIPTCHNPTGRTLSIEKRKKIVELSVRYNFLVVADEVYQLLSFPHITPPPPMFTFDEHGTVLALGSFSKILAPALRLGWIQAKPRLMKTLVDSGQLDSSGGINPVISGIVHSAILSGKQDEHLAFAVDTLWRRADALMLELKKTLPDGVTYEIPDGGYFVLVRLPEHMNAGELLAIAEKHKVQFLPGSSFSESMKNYLRLSFSWYDEADLQLGVRRLSAAIVDYQKILDTRAATTTTAASAASSAHAPLTVAVHGASGRLGALIVAQLAQQQEIAYAGAIDLRANQDIAALSTIDVIIDVTRPEATQGLINYLLAKDVAAFKNGKRPALVVGTTGALPLEALEKYGDHAAVVLKSNFSVGVPLVADLIQRAAFKLPSEGWNVEISEIHHTKKLDAPSGTAKTLAKSLASTGAACTGPSGEIPMQSLRLGDEIGQHTVYFAGPGERIEITHQATRREVFAIGALRAAKAATRAPRGVQTE